MSDTHKFEMHAHVVFQGLEVSDCSIASGELIWVGAGAMDGAWLTAAQAKEFAALINKVADAHMARTTKDAVAA